MAGGYDGGHGTAGGPYDLRVDLPKTTEGAFHG